MHVFSFSPTNQIMSTIRRKTLPKMFTRCSKDVSVITNIRYKSVRYKEVFLWEFDRDSAGSLKRCPLYSMSAIDRFDLFSKLTNNIPEQWEEFNQSLQNSTKTLPASLFLTLGKFKIFSTQNLKLYLTISLVNVNISTVNCRFIRIY